MLSSLQFSLILTLGIVPALWASSSDGLIVGLETIPNRVRNDNPSLAAARWRIAEAEGRHQASGLRDNPIASAGIEQNHELREGRLEVGLSQRFPLTNRLLIERRITVTQIAVARAEVADVERILIQEARAKLVEILAIREQRALRGREIALSEEFASFLSEASRRAEMSPLDAGQARLEAATLRSDLTRLRASEAAAIGQLKPLLGMEARDTLNIAGQSLPQPRLVARDNHSNTRPDYQALLLEAQAARETVALEVANQYDDIEVGVVAGFERTEDAPEGLENEATLGLQVSFALPFWDKNEGNIAAAQAVVRRQEQEGIALQKLIQNEAGAALAEMQEWATLLRTIDGELIPLAKKQTAETSNAYRQGLGTLEAFLLSRRQQLAISESRIETLRQYHLTRIRYEAALGN